MELPQYIQKLNPSAAIMSDRVPNVELTGIKELSDTVRNFIAEANNYRDELNLSKAKKEYEVWLINEKENFIQNTTIDNLETSSTNFNQTAANKIDEVLRNNGIPWHKMQKASNTMQALYVPNNLQFTLQVANNVKNKTYQNNEQEYENNLGNLMSAASAAQLRGANGTALLDQVLKDAENSVDQAIAGGFLPASYREMVITKKKMQATAYFFGRLLKEDPSAAYDYVTHNAQTVLNDQAKLFESTSKTKTYQTIYSKSQAEFKDFQNAIKSLDGQTRIKAGIDNVYVDKELFSGSYMYDLGALYQMAKQQNMTLQEAVNDEALLSKVATPYSPLFTKDSIYYNDKTRDFAGMYINGVYVPPNLTPGTKYFNSSMRYLNAEMISAVRDAYTTFDAANRKSTREKDRLNYAQQLWEISKRLESENITGDIPTNVVYPTSSAAKNFKADPYKNIPMPQVTMPREDIIELIKQEAQLAGVPVAAALALFERESNFNPKAKGGSGEYGIGQLMPATARALGVNNPWNVLENVRASLKYYKGALNAAGGDPLGAYAGYNGGYGKNGSTIKAYQAGRGTNELRNNVAKFGKHYAKFKEQYGTK